MDGATGAVFGAIGGAVLGGAGNILLEIFKQRAERRGIASAIAGEISAILYNVKTRKFVEYFESLEKELRLPNPRPALWFFVLTDVEATPVIQAYMGRLGALGGQLPRRVAHFYTLHLSLRTETIIFARETNAIAGANRIAAALPLWRTTASEGDSLIADLLSLSGEQPEP